MTPETYRKVKELRPDLYRRVVEIGHIVTCSEQNKHDLLTLAAHVEKEVMGLVLQILEERRNEKALHQSPQR